MLCFPQRPDGNKDWADLGQTQRMSGPGVWADQTSRRTQLFGRLPAANRPTRLLLHLRTAYADSHPLPMLVHTPPCIHSHTCSPHYPWRPPAPPPLLPPGIGAVAPHLPSARAPAIQHISCTMLSISSAHCLRIGPSSPRLHAHTHTHARAAAAATLLFFRAQPHHVCDSEWLRFVSGGDANTHIAELLIIAYIAICHRAHLPWPVCAHSAHCQLQLFRHTLVNSTFVAHNCHNRQPAESRCACPWLLRCQHGLPTDPTRPGSATLWPPSRNRPSYMVTRLDASAPPARPGSHCGLHPGLARRFVSAVCRQTAPEPGSATQRHTTERRSSYSAAARRQSLPHPGPGLRHCDFHRGVARQIISLLAARPRLAGARF